MNSYTVVYRGISDREIGVHAKSRPSVPAPKRRVTTFDIGGRDGSYYDSDDFYEDITIPITFSFLRRDKSQWFTVYRAVKSWVLSPMLGNLSFSDDPGYYYKVKAVVITTTERKAWTIGEVTVEFICDPYTYTTEGDETMTLSGTASVINPGCTSHPIYEIYGTGECTLTVNGKTFTATVSVKTVIDTDKMITFDDETMLANTTVTGDYQEIWLQPEANTITITAGFTCVMTPRWRCL